MRKKIELDINKIDTLDFSPSKIHLTPEQIDQCKKITEKINAFQLPFYFEDKMMNSLLEGANFYQTKYIYARATQIQQKVIDSEDIEICLQSIRMTKDGATERVAAFLAMEYAKYEEAKASLKKEKDGNSSKYKKYRECVMRDIQNGNVKVPFVQDLPELSDAIACFQLISKMNNARLSPYFEEVLEQKSVQKNADPFMSRYLCMRAEQLFQKYPSPSDLEALKKRVEPKKKSAIAKEVMTMISLAESYRGFVEQSTKEVITADYQKHKQDVSMATNCLVGRASSVSIKNIHNSGKMY